MEYNYFGTNTRQAGHYFWKLGESQYDSSLQPLSKLPFNPEEFTKGKKQGEVELHFIDGYSILAIAGSPIDGRSGCKSVFFFKEDLTEHELVEKIKQIPAALKIIASMPFEVNINLK